MKHDGALSIAQIHEAIARAQERVEARLPGDEKLAHAVLRRYESRLVKAEANGGRA